MPHLVLLLGVIHQSSQYLSAYYVPGAILGSEFQASWFGNISKGHRRMKTPSPLGLQVYPRKSIGHQVHAY